MNDIEKLRTMLPHWIDHNKSHGEEYKKWADIIKNTGNQNIAKLLNKAVKSLAEADKSLTKAIEKLGCCSDHSHDCCTEHAHDCCADHTHDCCTDEADECCSSGHSH